MKKIPLIFLTCVLLSECTNKPRVDLTKDAEAIRNLENQYTVAIRNKDVDKILTLFSLDGVMMQPAKTIIIGAQDIRKKYESDFADTSYVLNTFSGAIDLIDVSVSGDLAYVRGNNRYNIKTATGIVERTEKWIDVWKKIDGQWKCVAGIWNYNEQ